VTVRETLVEVPKKISGADTGIVFNSPKTRAGARRVIPTLTSETAARLRAHCDGMGPNDFVFGLPNGSPFRPNQFRARIWNPAVARAGLGDPVMVTIRSHTTKHLGQGFRVTVENMVTGAVDAARFPVERDPAAARAHAEKWAVGRADALRGDWVAPEDRAPTPHALRHTAVAHWIAAGVTDQFKLKTWAGHRSIATIDRTYGHLLPRDATDAREALSAMRAMGPRKAADDRAAEAATEPAEVIRLEDRRGR